MPQSQSHVALQAWLSVDTLSGPQDCLPLRLSPRFCTPRCEDMRLAHRDNSNHSPNGVQWYLGLADTLICPVVARGLDLSICIYSTCYGPNMKCDSKAHCLSSWPPAGGSVWGACRTLRTWSLVGRQGGGSWVRGQSWFCPESTFSVPWLVLRYEQASSCSHHHAFPAMIGCTHSNPEPKTKSSFELLQ